MIVFICLLNQNKWLNSWRAPGFLTGLFKLDCDKRKNNFDNEQQMMQFVCAYVFKNNFPRVGKIVGEILEKELDFL